MLLDLQHTDIAIHKPYAFYGYTCTREGILHDEFALLTPI